MFIDIHTHRIATQHPDVLSVVNVSAESNGPLPPFCSMGIHPWDVTQDWRAQLLQLEQRLLFVENNEKGSNVVAIGECGLDLFRGIDIDVQMECLEAQLDLACKMNKAVIIHCVRAWDRLLQVVKPTSMPNPVIIHGFRGKPELAQQLIQKGFHLSFGEKFNAASLRLAWDKGRMWLETDESNLSIEQIYDSASKALSISPTDISVPGTITSGAISAKG